MTENAIQNILSDLDAWVKDAMEAHHLAGMAVGVVQDGKLIYGKGFGYADIALEKPVTTQTIFRIASISKTFTAIGIMQLWEQGKFNLDDPINDYLKAYQVRHPDPKAPPVTFRHLLTHTSGIGETRNIRELIEQFYLKTNPYGTRIGEPVIPLKEYTEGLLVPDVYPDQKWAYANLGYATLGQLIEDISGEPFPRYMVEHVFEPLGMHHSDYLFSHRVSHGIAQGYEYRKNKMRVPEQYYLPRMGARSVHTHLEDMAQFASALMNGGAIGNVSVLKPETLDLMYSPQYQKDQRFNVSMGFGFYIDHLNGHKVVGHDGNITGFCGNIMVAPDAKLAIIFLINNSFTLNMHLANALMRKLLGVPDLSNRLPHAEILEHPHLWKEICGFYGPPMGFLSNYRKWLIAGGEIEVYVKDNHLAIRSLSGMLKNSLRLYPADAKDPLFFESRMGELLSQVVFVRNREGFIDRFHASGGEFMTFYKRPRYKSLKFRLFAGIGFLVTLGLTAIGYNCLSKRNRK